MRASRLLFAAATVALSFTVTGCGRQACFTWTEAEGSCPAQAEALPFFTSPDCPGKVVSVDSEATRRLDLGLCCYDVTERELSNESLCGNGGFGGAGSTESSGFVSSTGQGGSSAVSTSGAGGSAQCSHCSDAFEFAPMQPLCPGSELLFKTMSGCACGGACSADCSDSFCAGSSTSMACFTCLEDKAGCMMEFSACANDL